MTNFFATMIAIMFFIIPVLAIALLIQFLRKKPIKKLGLSILGCIGLIIPLTILGVVTDPATWCDHEYKIVEEVAPTCIEDGRVVKHCSLCESDDTEHIDAIGHSMKEASRIEPTYDDEGKIIKKCERCDFEETELIDKLERPVTTVEPTDASKKETTKPTTKPTTTIESESPTTTKPSTTEKVKPTVEPKTAVEKFAESKNISVELAQSIEYVLGEVGYSLSQAYSFEQADDWANGRRFKVWIDMEYICYFYVQDEEVVSLRRANGDFVWKQAG